MKIHEYKFTVMVEDVDNEGSDVIHARLLNRLLCTAKKCSCNIGMMTSEHVGTTEESE